MQKLFIRSKTKNEKPYHFLIKKIRIYILAENKLKNSDFFFSIGEDLVLIERQIVFLF